MSPIRIEYLLEAARFQLFSVGHGNALLKSLRNLILIFFPGSQFAGFASVNLVRLVQSDANTVNVRIVERDENPRLGDFSLLKVLQYEGEALNVLLRVAALNVGLNFAIDFRKWERVRSTRF